MRKQLIRTLLVAGTAVAAMGLAVPAAVASGTWTVTGGPSYTATASSGTTFTLKDTTNSATFTCTVGTAAGSVTDQTSGASPFGTVTTPPSAVRPTSAAAPSAAPAPAPTKAGTTAHINGTWFTGGVTTGTISGIDHIFTASAFGINCTAEITGTAASPTRTAPICWVSPLRATASR